MKYLDIIGIGAINFDYIFFAKIWNIKIACCRNLVKNI